ncbi:MAG: hypothetical protein WC763_02105 [Candidatus Paceibacterota bacterium]|jgi:hypothetical protein
MKKKLTLLAIVAAIILIWIGMVKVVSIQDAKMAADTVVPADGWKAYSNTSLGFEAQIPEDFTVDESYFNYALGPGREIPGVAFDIPASMATGTNLSVDSRVSVEVLSRAACVPSDFVDTQSTGTPVTIGGNSYLSAISAGAGAGNRYDESIYVTKQHELCYGVRFFIHSTAIENYEPGTRRVFDRDTLMSTFKKIAETIQFI